MTVQIFLHSQFRTGSTYIWKKFREQPGCCAYYEPFHERLATLDHDYFKEFNAKEKVTLLNRHPEIRKPYFYEYRGFLQGNNKGVPDYKKAFPYDEFFHSDTNPDLLRYMNFLIESANQPRAFFKFTRSSMRVSWFRKNYPDSLNIYLYRNPRNQWQSYNQHLIANNNPYFLVRDVMIAGKNANIKQLLTLSTVLPLYNYCDDDFKREEQFYGLLLRSYTAEERYMVFYYIWLISLIENARHADYLLGIEDLCEHAAAKKAVNDYLAKKGVPEIDFSDANIESYKSYALDRETMERVEALIEKRIPGIIGPEIKKIIGAYKKNQAALPVSGRGSIRIDGQKKAGPRYSVENRMSEMASSIARNAVDILGDKDAFIDSIYTGYTYRLGNLLLSPVKKSLEMINKIKNRYNPNTARKKKSGE